MESVTENGESASTAVQSTIGTRNRRGTTFLNGASLDLPEETGIKFVSSRPDGWRFCNSLVIRQGSYVPPSREECLAKIPDFCRDEVCGMKDPACVEPKFVAGEYIFLIDLYRGPINIS